MFRTHHGMATTAMLANAGVSRRARDSPSLTGCSRCSTSASSTSPPRPSRWRLMCRSLPRLPQGLHHRSDRGTTGEDPSNARRRAHPFRSAARCPYRAVPGSEDPAEHEGRQEPHHTSSRRHSRRHCCSSCLRPGTGPLDGGSSIGGGADAQGATYHVAHIGEDRQAARPSGSAGVGPVSFDADQSTSGRAGRVAPRASDRRGSSAARGARGTPGELPEAPERQAHSAGHGGACTFAGRWRSTCTPITCCSMARRRTSSGIAGVIASIGRSSASTELDILDLDRAVRRVGRALPPPVRSASPTRLIRVPTRLSGASTHSDGVLSLGPVGCHSDRWGGTRTGGVGLGRAGAGSAVGAVLAKEAAVPTAGREHHGAGFVLEHPAHEVAPGPVVEADDPHGATGQHRPGQHPLSTFDMRWSAKR